MMVPKGLIDQIKKTLHEIKELDTSPHLEEKTVIGFKKILIELAVHQIENVINFSKFRKQAEKTDRWLARL